MSFPLDNSKKSHKLTKTGNQRDKSEDINFLCVPNCQFNNKGIIQFTKLAN